MRGFISFYSINNIIAGELTASASYDFNESQMQGTREKEYLALENIDRNIVRKLLLRFRAGLKANST